MQRCPHVPLMLACSMCMRMMPMFSIAASLCITLHHSQGQSTALVLLPTMSAKNHRTTDPPAQDTAASTPHKIHNHPLPLPLSAGLLRWQA
jgi:hypothetical protein